jgi:hypothetical protein
MSDKLLQLYCRAAAWRHAVSAPRPRLAGGKDAGMMFLPGGFNDGPEAGISKLAITLILLAVGVGLTLAVVAIIAPELIGLAENTAEKIKSVPVDDWGD